MKNIDSESYFDLPYEDKDGKRIIKMPKTFGIEYNIEIRSRIIDSLKETDGDIVLDMEKTEFIDSSAISVIIMIFNLLRDDERKLIIINTYGMVKEALDMTKISNVIDIT